MSIANASATTATLFLIRACSWSSDKGVVMVVSDNDGLERENQTPYFFGFSAEQAARGLLRTFQIPNEANW
jgi:hypothetical protein